MRTERTVGGVINMDTGDQSPSTLIIENPVHADFKPWLGKKSKVVNVQHQYGSMTGALVIHHRKMMKVQAFNQHMFAYITFSADDVSEIDITGDYAPTIYLRNKRVSFQHARRSTWETFKEAIASNMYWGMGKSPECLPQRNLTYADSKPVIVGLCECGGCDGSCEDSMPELG